MSETQNTAAAAEAGKGHRVVGRVISNKAAKTITVLVERKVRHPLYGKYVSKSTKLHAHDEKGECKEGDLVEIVETRPLSRTKRFRLVEVLKSTGAKA